VRPGNPRRFAGFHGYLVGGDWNHGILNDFPQKLGMSWNGKSSQLTNSLHHFSEGQGSTTNQGYNWGYRDNQNPDMLMKRGTVGDSRTRWIR
jgi:hypothetical protein